MSKAVTDDVEPMPVDVVVVDAAVVVAPSKGFALLNFTFSNLKLHLLHFRPFITVLFFFLLFRSSAAPPGS